MKRMLCLICSNSACPTHNIITTLMCTIKKSSCVSFWQLEYSATVKCSAFNSCLCHKCLYYIKQSKESLLILFTSLKNIKKLYCSICSLSEFLNSLISVLGPKTPYELGPNVYILFCVYEPCSFGVRTCHHLYWSRWFWKHNNLAHHFGLPSMPTLDSPAMNMKKCAIENPNIKVLNVAVFLFACLLFFCLLVRTGLSSLLSSCFKIVIKLPPNMPANT